MRKVLIVDDFEMIVDMLYSCLKDDYECICGYYANDIISHKNEVDLIVTDYGLIKIDENGEEDFIWSTEMLKNITIPKILITGVDPDDDHNNFYEDVKHVDSVFFKPLEVRQLKLKIDELLEKANA